MLFIRKNGATSNVFRVKLRRSDTGQGLTGLSSASTGLIISTIADNESTATNYTVAGTTIQTITTLGTFAAPSASNCRFKEVDSTNQPGVYEFQFADARFAISSAKYLMVSVAGAATLLEKEINIQLTSMDIDDGVHGGMSAIPNTAVTTNGSLPTVGTGTAQISLTSGRIDLGKWVGTSAPVDASGFPMVTTNSVYDGVSTYGNFAIDATNSYPVVAIGRVSGTAGSLSNNAAWQPIVKAIFQDATGTNYTTASSIGKSLYTSGTAPGASGGLFIAGTNASTTVTGALASTFTGNLSGNVTGSVASVTGNILGNVVGSVGSVTAAVSLSSADSEVMQTGTAASGGASTITIQSALGADSLPVGCLIKITSGTGMEQCRVITAYVNSTKVVTVDRAWTTNPDSTSVYTILYANLTALSAGLKVTEVALTDTATNLTNSPTSGDLTATMKTSITSAVPTTAQIATGVWQDSTAGDFTTASSIGKALYIANVAPGALGGHFIAGTNAATTITGSLTTSFSGTLTTVTNLTNAATSGDLTSTMKTSVTSAVPTAAQVATATWTDTTSSDFTTTSSPGKILVTQLGGTFTTTGSSVFTVSALTNGPSGSGASAASIATAVWQDVTAGDFNVTSSIGKSLYTAGVVPGGAGGLFIAGTNSATTANITGTFTGNLTGRVLGGGATAFSGVGVEADVQTIKTQAVTCSAGVTVSPFIGNAGGVLTVASNGLGQVNVSQWNGSSVSSSADSVPLIGVQGYYDSNNDTVSPVVLNGSLPSFSVGSVTAGAITSAGFTVASPSGAATGILEKIAQIWRRFFSKAVHDLNANTITTYADDGVTVLTTQSATATTSAETQGPAS